MRNRAQDRRSKDQPVANLASGEVDHPPPPAALESAVRALSDPAVHRYGPTAGLLTLRSAIAERLAKAEAAVDLERVVVTVGAKQALYITFLALLDPGDTVLVPVPSWPTYVEGIRLAGGYPVTVPTTAQDSFKVSVDQLAEQCTPATKAVVLGTPNNPTGSVYSRNELTLLAEWVLARGLWLILDQVYDELDYQGPRQLHSLLGSVPEIDGRCVAIDSVAKRWAMPGWRVGWLVGPRDVTAAVARIQSHTSSHVPNICQAAATAAIGCGDSTVDSIRKLLTVNRSIAVEHLRNAGLTCASPQGSFYVFANVEELLRELPPERGGGSSTSLANHLLDEYEVAVVPGEGFGAPGHIRISFGRQASELARGLDALAAFASAT
jgi:aspartate aminotransferase